MVFWSGTRLCQFNPLGIQANQNFSRNKIAKIFPTVLKIKKARLHGIPLEIRNKSRTVTTI